MNKKIANAMEVTLKSPNLKQKAFVAAIAALIVQQASANPTGATVVSGTVTMQTSGSTLNITNSPNAIINWAQFNIGVGETTKFIQQSASSTVLNRITGQDPSSILGTLQSNGRVFLINPNGIVFGAGSQVNVSGLVASTQNISNADFLAGKMNFVGNSTAAVINQGVIETPSGGRVYLIAQDVRNSGVIHTPQGEVWLAAGKAVTLVDDASPEMRVTITAPGNSSINMGQIIAENGVIGLVGKNVTQAGQISTASVTSEGGRIILRATDVATVTVDSVADAGQGGDIKVWSDQDSFVHGELRAQNGFIETSGKYLDITGIKIDAKGGSWLLDPTDITIGASDSGQTASGGNPNTYTSVGASSTIAASTINGALDAGTSVILDTTGIGGTGNITLLTGNFISKSNGGNASLTLLADHNIDIQAGSSITSTVGALNINLHANNAGATTGTVSVNGTITTNNGNVDIVGPSGVAINNAINAGSGIITAVSSGAGVSLGAGGSLTSTAAGNAVVLAANTAFVNNAGAGAISTAGGRWLIYSSDPASDTFGALSSSNLALWNKTYASYAPGSVIETGNRYLFANQPVLTVTADAKSKVYGDAIALTSTVTGLTNAATYGGVFSQDTYSGTPSLTSSGTSLTAGVAGSPYVITTAAGTFAAPTGYAATNYVNGSLTVTARPISVSANAAQSKIYGDADPALAYTVSLGNLVNGDALVLTRAAGENVGGYAMSLTANANYNVTYTGGNFSITPATLLYVSAAANRVYGDANPAFAGTVTGFKGSDTLDNATTGTAAWASSATSIDAVGSYAINGSGLAANNGNYTFASAVGNATALTITPRAITLSADAKTKTYGDADPALTYVIGGSGLVNGDTLTGSLARSAGENVNSYAINQGTLAVSGNYAASYVGADLVINKAALTVAADNASKVYGDANPAFTSTLTGFKNGESLATSGVSGNAALTTTVDGTTSVGTAGITAGAGTLAASNYSFTGFTPGTLTITQRAITLSADAKAKVYGDADPALTYVVGGSGLVNGDTLTGGLIRATGESAGTYGITQGTLNASANYNITGFTGNNLTIAAAVVAAVPAQEAVVIPPAVKSNPNPVLDSLFVSTSNTIIQAPVVTKTKQDTDTDTAQNINQPSTSKDTQNAPASKLSCS